MKYCALEDGVDSEGRRFQRAAEGRSPQSVELVRVEFDWLLDAFNGGRGGGNISNSVETRCLNKLVSGLCTHGQRGCD